jgi:AcrR family transcriptional regulator
MTESSVARPLRADARRNRDRLLDVARTAFEEHGTDASLDEIARRAGVGIGTLYRHFPTRDALLETLIADDLERLIELADELVAEGGSDGVERWLSALVGHAVTFRGLADSMLGATRAHSALGEICVRLHRAGASVVREAQRRGLVRRDIDPVDAVDLATAIAWLTEADPEEERRRALLRVAVDGLRTPTGAPRQPRRVRRT